MLRGASAWPFAFGCPDSSSNIAGSRGSGSVAKPNLCPTRKSRANKLLGTLPPVALSGAPVLLSLAFQYLHVIA